MGKETTAFDYDKERDQFNWDIPADYNFVDVIRAGQRIAQSFWQSLSILMEKLKRPHTEKYGTAQ